MGVLVVLLVIVVIGYEVQRKFDFYLDRTDDGELLLWYNWNGERRNKHL